jgi:hypothetical protein
VKVYYMIIAGIVLGIVGVTMRAQQPIPAQSIVGPAQAWVALPYSTGGNVLEDYNTQQGVTDVQPGGYWKDSTGRVWLKGVVTCVSAGSVPGGTLLFVLPSGYAPSANTRVLVAPATGATQPQELQILGPGSGTPGNVTLSGFGAWSCTPGNNVLSFEGVSFTTN